MAGNSESRTKPIAALAALSLLWAGGTLRPILPIPGSLGLLPRLERQALPFALLAALSCGFAFRRRARWPRGRPLWNAVLVGLGLFVVPAWLLSRGDARIPGAERTALLTLTPVFALVFEPHLGQPHPGRDEAGSVQSKTLLAALASVAGALCVFPVEIPGSIEFGIAFCAVILAAACVAAANCKAVAMTWEAHDPVSTDTLAAIAAAVAALAFAVGSATHEQPAFTWSILGPELIWSAVVDVPALALLFWLMGKMSAARMATRNTWAPMIAVASGAALMQAALAWRTWLGLMLMAAGAGYLVLAPEPEPESNRLSLR